jgi:hypothetical protein
MRERKGREEREGTRWRCSERRERERERER